MIRDTVGWLLFAFTMGGGWRGIARRFGLVK